MLFLQTKPVHEPEDYLIAFLMFLLLAGPILFITFYNVVFIHVQEPLVRVWYRITPPRVTTIQRSFLLRNFQYYQQLPPNLKQEFEYRMVIFLKCKKFIPRGIELTEKMKWQIAACAIQLTLGLKRFRLIDFNKIFVMPDTYVHAYASKGYRGHVNPSRNSIYLAWRHFHEGYMINDDGVNVGLHEMVHALYFQLMKKDVDWAFFDSYEKWEEVAKEKLKIIQAEQNKFLRNYAGTNMDELFAVSVEYFFEKPDEFKRALPELYNALSRLLNQDPAHPVIIPRLPAEMVSRTI